MARREPPPSSACNHLVVTIKDRAMDEMIINPDPDEDILDIFESAQDFTVQPVDADEIKLGFKLYLRKPMALDLVRFREFYNGRELDKDGNFVNDEDTLNAQARLIIYCLCREDGSFFYGSFDINGNNIDDPSQKTLSQAIRVIHSRSDELQARLFNAALEVAGFAQREDGTVGNEEAESDESSATSSGNALPLLTPEVIQAP